MRTRTHSAYAVTCRMLRAVRPTRAQRQHVGKDCRPTTSDRSKTLIEIHLDQRDTSVKTREIENGVNSQAMFSAWDKGLADAARDPDTKQQLMQQEKALLPTFAEQYRKLAVLPRRARRGLQRQWKRSLAGIALLMALGTHPALSVTINVGGQCTAGARHSVGQQRSLVAGVLQTGSRRGSDRSAAQ